MIPNYAVIKLKTDAYLSEGVDEGAIGTITDIVGEDAYEVEFTDQDTNTIAVLVLKASEMVEFDPFED